MSKAILISEMQKFRFGSKIMCADGEDGTLVSLVFDPTTRCLTHIGVKQGLLLGKTVQLPFDTIVAATSDGITLRLKNAELTAANSEVKADSVILSSKSIVERAGTVNKGSLTLIAAHPGSGKLAYVVAHHLLPGQDTLLREELITVLTSEHVVVTIAEMTSETFPPYRPDRVLQQEVEAILFDLTPLHIDRKGLTIRVLDGVLYLDGNTSSTLRRDIVQDQVLGVQGLLEIKNDLIGDDTLAADLAMALGNDARTRDLPIGVYPRLGVVRLNGAVRTSQQKATAEEIARSFPSVRSVVNELSVDPKAEQLHVMSATGGDEDRIPNKYTRHTK